LSTELTTEANKLTTTEINTVTAEIIILKQQTAINIIEIGKRLLAVKDSLAHGKWGKWLSEKVDFTDRTAQRFMKAATEFSNATALSDLPQTKIFALLDLPADEREEFIQSNPVGEMTTRELQQAITEKNEALKKLEIAEEEVKQNKLLYKKVSESYDKLEKTNKEHYDNAEKLRKELEETKSLLLTAQSSGDNDEAIRLQESLDNTDNELTNALEKIEELERQLREKPIEVEATTSETVTVEVIPEGIEDITRFAVQFEALIKGFGEILNLLEAVSRVDKEAGEKRKKALSVTLSKMLERL